MTAPDSPAGALAEALAREVHAAWRDGVLNQGREVAAHRMNWDTLSWQDRELDHYIAIRVSAVLLAQQQPAPASARSEALAGEQFNWKGWIGTGSFLWQPDGDAAIELIDGQMLYGADFADFLGRAGALAEENRKLRATEKIMDDACKLWREIGHPMLLAAALELDQARAALAAAEAGGP